VRQSFYCTCLNKPPFLIYEANVVLYARIDFEVVGELTIESRDRDGLAGAQPAHVDACRSANEGMNFAGAIIDEDDESEWQTLRQQVRVTGRLADTALPDCSCSLM
jgi:hypothetical protein